jgi:hypothetical protein
MMLLATLHRRDGTRAVIVVPDPAPETYTEEPLEVTGSFEANGYATNVGKRSTVVRHYVRRDEAADHVIYDEAVEA